jgi:UDP:flavonoid glycosyltransferase YjiC (YdhE family)
MKILAIANAHALAHVSRLLEIAKVLRARGHELAFAGHGKYLQIAGWDGFAIHELPYISVDRVIEAVRSQKLWTLYREAELETFIDAELTLYQAYQPDLVLLDNRPSARTSADLAGLPTAAVLNVHMSNYRRIPFFSYRQLTGGLPGAAMADRLENALERQIYDKVVMGGLNAIRKKRGLKRRYAYEHEEGDLSLLADLPEFNPVSTLPAHARFIGPLTWHNTLPAPACLDKLDPAKPTAYFSLGSEGLDELAPHLGLLARQGIQVVVATGAARVGADWAGQEGIFLESYVNTEMLLPHCDIVCCHGGNGTLYQALAHGLPSVVVATHAEQHYGGKRIQSLGLGRSTTLKSLKRKGMGTLVNLVRETLASPDCRARAQAFSAYFKGWNSAMGADEIERWSSA